MKGTKWMSGVLACTWIAASLHAQVELRDLGDEIDAGRVRLVSATGRGGSSGLVVDGHLANNTGADRRLSVFLERPIYLVNQGAGQNMVVSEVYLNGGQYLSDGERPFIALPANDSTQVSFVAYCVDFDKDNPSDSDRFSVGSPPALLAPVIANINTYASANPNIDITIPAQVAIWIAQGENLKEIRLKFPFSAADEQLAQNFATR